MNLQSLRDLYVDSLKDIYSAEKQLIEALPKMAKGAKSPELKTAFEDHLEETRTHVERLEKIFERLGKSPRGKRCKGMEGLIEEGSEMLEADGDESVIDAGLIIGAQKVEHYEIAAYGSVRTFAELLNDTKSAELLQETLDEEGATDQRLTEIAERIVNPESMEAKVDDDGRESM